MINKHCLRIYIDADIPYKSLKDDFTKEASEKYVICDSIDEADLVVSCEKKNSKIHILISEDSEFKSGDEHDYYFQPYLNGKTGNINQLQKELWDFVGFIVDDYNLPYKKDNTILLVH